MYDGGKLPRKVKKKLLGLRVSKKDLREQIKNVKIEIHNPYNNGYTYDYPNDTFCPECGCIFTYDTGNIAEYPEEWIKFYCVKCGECIAYRDNGEVWHKLMDYKEYDEKNNMWKE
jgi:transcription initiation factor IIE alpha subunit